MGLQALVDGLSGCRRINDQARMEAQVTAAGAALGKADGNHRRGAGIGDNCAKLPLIFTDDSVGPRAGIVDLRLFVGRAGTVGWGSFHWRVVEAKITGFVQNAGVIPSSQRFVKKKEGCRASQKFPRRFGLSSPVVVDTL